MTAPRYQEFGPEAIPRVTPADGVEVKVIAGRVGDVVGPIEQPATEPVYLDVTLDAGARFEHALPEDHTAFAYVYEGQVRVGESSPDAAGSAATIEAPELAVLGPGARAVFEGRAPRSRLILIAGKPLREPVARYGPFVMNTRAQIAEAFADFQAGRF
jgi:redox-sensitive bicupin YhaK (pirin superfamily)